MRLIRALLCPSRPTRAQIALYLVHNQAAGNVERNPRHVIGLRQIDNGLADIIRLSWTI